MGQPSFPRQLTRICAAGWRMWLNGLILRRVWLSKPNSRDFNRAASAMNNSMLPLPGLSSASGKPVVVKFDGGLLSSDGGVLALREVEQRLRVAGRLAACMIDPRAAAQITHSLADVIRFRLLMISAGYEDGNDANSLRRDPMFKMALIFRPSIGSCARSRQYRGWKICRTFAPCCEWAGRWSICIPSPSPRFPNGSRWTSTTRSMRSTVVSSCGCSTPTTTNTDFSRSSCSTARAASSPPCFVPPSGRAARRSSPSWAPVARDPRSLA